MSKTAKLKLTDIVDIEFLQKFQDSFAEATGVASIMVDDNGPITKPSNFTDFCIKLTRGCAEGYKNCNECDINWGKIAAETGQPVIYSCHTGLTDFAVPIMVQGQHIASILGGQVLTQKPDISHFKKIAKKYGIDEKDYLKALNKIKVLPPEQIKGSAKLLFTVANSISEMANKNIELIKTNLESKKLADKEKILREIIESSRSSLEIDEVKKSIVDKLGKDFNADRCYFRAYDKKTNLFSAPDVEYLASSKVESLKKINPDQNGLEYFSEELEKIKKGFYPIVIDATVKNHALTNYMESINAKAIYACPIIDIEDECIWLVLHYLNEDPKLDESYKKLLEIIAYHVGTALNQLKLYEIVKKQTQREFSLRKIIENMRNSFDIEEILGFICAEITKIFNVQRAVIAHHSENNTETIFTTRKEYIVSSKFKSIANPETFKDVALFWSKSVIESKKAKVFNNIEESNAPTSFKQGYAGIGIKSAIGTPIKKGENVWGILVLFQYEDTRVWTEEEKLLLEDISNQIYIAIQQSELYSTIQKKANIENVLRKIMSSSVNTFDTKKIINSMVTETCQLFGADRCLFLEYTNENDFEAGLKSYSEYLATPGIKTASVNIPQKKVIDAIIKLLKKRDFIISENTEKDKFLKETKEILVSEEIKSFLVAPVYFGEKDYGAIILHYVKEYKKFNNEEIELIKAIASQSAAIIHQAKLYQTIEKNEKYTRTVLENITDGIITIDKNFVIKSCNPAVKNIWGYEPEECINKKLDVLLKYNCNGKVQKQCLTNNSVSGIKKGGTEFPVEISLSDITTENIKNILLVIRDITERKRIEQMKSEFVSTVSHELRTPLTSLKGSLGLAMSGKMGELPEKVKNLLDIANSNCTRLINLINDILDIEKIEAGKMDFDIKTFELIPLIEQVIQLNIQFAQKFDVKMNIIKSVESIFVQVDSNRFAQVLTNLISNAIKFSNPNSAVDISIANIDKNIRVSVTNYGAEIPQEFRNRIFQKFAQGDSSDSRQKGGTGLGLSISKAIIEKMNGKIGFVSENQETTFYIELPCTLENN